MNRRRFLQGSVSGLIAGACMPRTRWTAAAAPAPILRAQRLAWAGVRLQLPRATLFLDPLISADVWGTALRDPMVPVDVGEGARYVLTTHRHPDHFDIPAIKKALGDNGMLVGTAETVALAAARGVRGRVASLYEPVLLSDDFTVTAVPAVDGYGDAQVSWVVSGGGRRIIHCGDTLWHGSWWHIGRTYGPFDAAFLPINGARFKWRTPVSDVSAVLTPEQATAAAVVLGARLIVPIHYGVVGADGYAEVANPEAALLESARRREVGVEIVRPGEWLTWRPRA